MRNYIRKADRIDKERGDVLQLPKQFLEPLYSSDYPVDARRDILDALVGWFIGREIPKLKNPLANAQLQGFINQQKEAVQSYLDLCRVNANNRARQPNEDGATTVPQGRRSSTAVGNKRKETVNVKDKRNESFTVDVSGVDADATPDTSITATALTEAEARQTIAAFAPPATEEIYGKEFVEAEERSGIGGKFVELEQFSCDFILSRIDEKGNALTRNALLKFRREVGADVLWRAWVRFYNDKTAAKDRGEPFTNPGALFMSRLKSIREALSVMPSGASAR